jgi:hypothetical protein
MVSRARESVAKRLCTKFNVTLLRIYENNSCGSEDEHCESDQGVKRKPKATKETKIINNERLYTRQQEISDCRSDSSNESIPDAYLRLKPYKPSKYQ